MAFSLNTDAFVPNEAIPSRYTCDGEDVSPALSWSDVPSATAAFALIVDDPDAPGRVFTHWALFNLPSSLQGLPEGVPTIELLENGGIQGKNDFGKIGYRGPCPPRGSPHRYRFFLYALDSPIDLEPGASKQQVLDRIQGHILAEAQITGTYQR